MFSPSFFSAIEEEKEIGEEDVGAFSPRERNHLLLWEDYNAEEVFEAKEGVAHTGLGVVDANQCGASVSCGMTEADAFVVGEIAGKEVEVGGPRGEQHLSDKQMWFDGGERGEGVKGLSGVKVNCIEFDGNS